MSGLDQLGVLGQRAPVRVELEDPGPGEVQLALRASAVTVPDLLMIQGK
ncbi:MAG: hypothetical protein ACFCVK_21170 [Acidimicrobiales bacterium]